MEATQSLGFDLRSPLTSKANSSLSIRQVGAQLWILELALRLLYLQTGFERCSRFL